MRAYAMLCNDIAKGYAMISPEATSLPKRNIKIFLVILRERSDRENQAERNAPTAGFPRYALNDERVGTPTPERKCAYGWIPTLRSE